MIKMKTTPLSLLIIVLQQAIYTSGGTVLEDKSGTIVAGEFYQLMCTTDDVNSAISFEHPKNSIVGTCLSSGFCSSSNYDMYQDRPENKTYLNITSYNRGRDDGEWLCVQGSSVSDLKTLTGYVRPTNVTEIPINNTLVHTDEDLTLKAEAYCIAYQMMTAKLLTKLNCESDYKESDVVPAISYGNDTSKCPADELVAEATVMLSDQFRGDKIYFKMQFTHEVLLTRLTSPETAEITFGCYDPIVCQPARCLILLIIFLIIASVIFLVVVIFLKKRVVMKKWKYIVYIVQGISAVTIMVIVITVAFVLADQSDKVCKVSNCSCDDSPCKEAKCMTTPLLLGLIALIQVFVVIIILVFCTIQGEQLTMKKAVLNSDVKLTCNFSSVTNPVLQWFGPGDIKYTEDTNIVQTDVQSYLSVDKDDKAKVYTLTIQNIERRFTGVYSCRVNAKIETRILLTVIEPPPKIMITSKPKSSHADKYILKWKVLENGGSPITSYIIRYTEVTVFKKSNTKEWQIEKYMSDYKEIELQNGDLTAKKITGLGANKFYEIEITACNKKGFGDPATIVIKTGAAAEDSDSEGSEESGGGAAGGNRDLESVVSKAHKETVTYVQQLALAEETHPELSKALTPLDVKKDTKKKGKKKGKKNRSVTPEDQEPSKTQPQGQLALSPRPLPPINRQQVS